MGTHRLEVYDAIQVIELLRTYPGSKVEMMLESEPGYIGWMVCVSVPDDEIDRAEQQQQAEPQEPEFHRVKEQDCYSRIRRDLESIKHNQPMCISRILQDLRLLFNTLIQSNENANRKAVDAHKEKCRLEEEVKSLKAEMREMNEELNDPMREVWVQNNPGMVQLLATIRELAGISPSHSNRVVCDIAIPWLTAVVRQEKSNREQIALRDKQIEDMDKKLDEAFSKLNKVAEYASALSQDVAWSGLRRGIGDSILNLLRGDEIKK